MDFILQNSKFSEFQVLTTNLITKLQAHQCRVLSLIISKAQVRSFPDDSHNQMVGCSVWTRITIYWTKIRKIMPEEQKLVVVEWGWAGNFGVSGGYFHNIPPDQERPMEWKKK